MELKLAVIPGDGIGPDIIKEAEKVLHRTAELFDHSITFEHYLAGGAAIDKTGEPLPKRTLEGCQRSDSVLLGAVGGPAWDDLGGDMRPEAALLGLRAGLGLYANLRPAILYPQLADACPLKQTKVPGGLDIMVVRELTGGIYFGEKGRRDDGAFDTLFYSRKEVERIARVAFDIAKKRGKVVTSVDKANVLESSRFWRETVKQVAADYPEIELNHMYVDNAAMQLVWNPKQFDVILTGNMFGDILSDEASMITGSIGMLPSASLRTDSFGMYEPIHGSAPDIAGKDMANPIATVLSVAMMLRYSFGLTDEADVIEKAVASVLDGPWRTADIMSEGMEPVGTKQMGDLISQHISRG